MFNGPQVATLVNWWSKNCNANWTQAYLSSYGLSHTYGLEIWTDTADTDSLGRWERTVFPNTSDTNNVGKVVETWDGTYYYNTAAAYTDMVDGNVLTKSCIVIADSNGNDVAAGTYSNTSSSSYCVFQ